MPLIFLARFLTGLVSFVILGLAIYLITTWYRGDWVAGTDGVLERVREDWRLWTGLGMLTWSFVGRWIIPLLIARGDTEPTRALRGDGAMVPGVQGAELYVERHGAGEGPPVVLTHGWGLDSTIWTYARRHLGGRFQLITWDLPGLGRSRIDGRLTLEVLSENLKTIVDRAGQPVILVGHSIGGMTIQTLARDHPEYFRRQVRGVILLNTTYTNPLQTMILSELMKRLRGPILEPLMRLAIGLQPLAWLGAWQSYLSGSAHLANRLGFGRYVTRSQLEHTTLLVTRNSPAVQAKGNLAMFRWDADGALARSQVPTLIVGGKVDVITKLEASEHLRGQTRQARLLEVEGVNHMGFLERPDLYNAEIAGFIEGLSAENSAGSAVSHAPVLDIVDAQNSRM